MSKPEKFVPLFPPYLNQGSSGAAVIFLQQLLIANGQAPEGLIPDGDYGAFTAEGVTNLQNDLDSYEDAPDGNLGSMTRQAMVKDWGFDVDAIPAMPNDITNWVGPDHEGLKVWPEAEEVEADAAPPAEDGDRDDRIEVNGEKLQLVELG